LFDKLASVYVGVMFYPVYFS